MSLSQISRLKAIQAVAEGNLRAVTAAAQLGLSRRQINRLADRYRDDGPSGLVSKKRGLRHHQLPASVVDLALSIIRDRYSDFGPTLACEKLRERHGIVLAKETIRKFMTEAGLWIPRKQRPPSIYQPRHRRSCIGELIQIDGSNHHWFEDRGAACSILVYLDDATSQLLTEM